MFDYIKSSLGINTTESNLEIGTHENIVISEEIKIWLKYIGRKNIYIPWTVEELIICGINEIFSFQIGYSILFNGEKAAQWPDGHIVISTIIGDPICINDRLQVVHAVHGIGAWNFNLVTNNLSNFDKAVACFINAKKIDTESNTDEIISQSLKIILEDEYKKLLSPEEIAGMFSIIEL
jgi:hypothetical protein